MRHTILCLSVFAAGIAIAASAFATGTRTGRVYTGRVGDELRVSKAAVRCTVSHEAGAVNLLCAHTPSGRYTVAFYRDNFFVYRNGNPARIVFSARGRP
jgi:hypothetical protein